MTMGRPVTADDLLAVRQLLARAPLLEAERFRIEAILGRADLTYAELWPVRVALLALQEASDRLNGAHARLRCALGAFPVRQEPREWSRRVAP
jgi:hypothetical protein